MSVYVTACMQANVHVCVHVWNGIGLMCMSLVSVPCLQSLSTEYPDVVFCKVDVDENEVRISQYTLCMILIMAYSFHLLGNGYSAIEVKFVI